MFPNNDPLAINSVADPQDQPDETAEEETAPEDSPSTETETPKEEAPKGDDPKDDDTDEDEDKPSEEGAEDKGEPKPTGKEDPEKPEPEQGNSRKGKGLQHRFRELTGEIKDLRQNQAPQGDPSQTDAAQPQQPAQQPGQAPAAPQAVQVPSLYGNQTVKVPDNPQEATAMLQDVDAYLQQNGELPPEMDEADVRHLIGLAKGRTQAAADTQVAQLQQTVAELVQDRQQEQAKAAVKERTTEVMSAIDKFVESNPALNPDGGDDFDPNYDKAVTEGLEQALRLDAERISLANAAGRKVEPLDVAKWLENFQTAYEAGNGRGGESASTDLRNQASRSAIPPSGSTPKGVKPAHLMDDKELDEYLAKQK